MQGGRRRLTRLIAAGAMAVTAGVTASCASPTEAGAGPGLRAGAVPAAYEDWVRKAGDTCSTIVSPLLAAQIEVESGWNSTARSRVGALGLAQFMPGTWTAWGHDDDHNGRTSPLDPGDAILAQARYMCALSGQVRSLVESGRATGDPIDLALAAYNAGLGNVQRYHGIPPFAETTAYVSRIRGLETKYAVDGAGSTGQGATGIVAAAEEQLGKPYVWGGGGWPQGPSGVDHVTGRGPGFDCSGLVQWAVGKATHGRVVLPHYSGAQARAGSPVPAKLAAMRPGDIIAMSQTPGGRITHVGIYAGHGQMIHAPETGKFVSSADLTNGYWTTQWFWTVRRIK